ncbi:helix-turn-helix domain-containing protein [Convivina intestini]|uniref:Transcriptional regulator with XRE-family HTH domain n=1 Tax=Convivina intestini TaxID=1505726 RepID=A0A2U1DC35_9LACO|nr:helix-turn-helix transcriptional regulator [Convivina intestini]PVY85228.1 transcriptional regulator with XRE-family HTH domain [Convivina intestini]CAH1852510.1 hypothetical protein R077811_00446 [Convivina intestini]SDC01434.1 Transcriptional regulator, contains XRE-family HTH domain [Leuconostocaceae bacterium R-53105]
MRFGDRLKVTRTNKGLTQDGVAQHFHVSRQTISIWENEKTYPDVASLVELSDYYQISLDTLLKEDTGMREALQRKEVVKNLKPIRFSLMGMDFIILIWLIFSMVNGSRPSSIAGLFMWPMFILLLIAIYQLNKFDESYHLGLKWRWQEYTSGQHGLKYALIVPVIFIVGGLLIIMFWHNSSIRMGVGFGMISAALGLAAFLYFKNTKK